MKFQVIPKRRRQRPGAEEPTFTISRLWTDETGEPVEITHLFDRSYGYRSLRELAWHLAARFDLSPKAIQLECV
jgi:hypothetical protein